jgi:hypothetical protein
VSEPPPMATSAETAPMPLPTAKTPPQPGNSRAAFGFRLRIICAATRQTKAVKNRARGLDGTLPAKKRAKQRADENPRGDLDDDFPQHGAVLVVGAQAGQRGKQDRGHRRAERQMEDLAGGNPACAANIMVSVGTITSPPPMPSMPAKKPVNRPSAMYASHQSKQTPFRSTTNCAKATYHPTNRVPHRVGPLAWR